MFGFDQWPQGTSHIELNAKTKNSISFGFTAVKQLAKIKRRLQLTFNTSNAPKTKLTATGALQEQSRRRNRQLRCNSGKAVNLLKQKFPLLYQDNKHASFGAMSKTKKKCEKEKNSYLESTVKIGRFQTTPSPSLNGVTL